MKIIFPISLYEKLRLYVINTKNEISGLGRIELVDGHNFYVTEIALFSQEVSGTHTKLNRDALGDFLYELMQKGEDPGQWKLWWHTHADFEVFFSQTDLATIEDFNNDDFVDNWIVSLVTNHKGEYQCRLDLFYPFRMTKDVSLVIRPEDKLLEEEVKKEIQEKVTVKPTHIPAYPNGTYKFPVILDNIQPPLDETWE